MHRCLPSVSRISGQHDGWPVVGSLLGSTRFEYRCARYYSSVHTFAVTHIVNIHGVRFFFFFQHFFISMKTWDTDTVHDDGIYVYADYVYILTWLKSHRKQQKHLRTRESEPMLIRGRSPTIGGGSTSKQHRPICRVPAGSRIFKLLNAGSKLA